MAFESLYTHGFARVAAAVPHLKPADPAFNVERTIALAAARVRRARRARRLPELGLSAYAIDDLFHQDALIDAVPTRARSASSRPAATCCRCSLVGGPLRAQHGLFNCAVVIHRGRVLGVVPKSYLPNYREYYEERQFRAAREFVGDERRAPGRDACRSAPT